MPRPPSTQPIVQRTSPRTTTRASTRTPSNHSSSPATSANKSSPPRQPKRSPPSRRNTITIKRAFLTSDATARGTTPTTKPNPAGNNEDELGLESDELDLQSGPELSASDDAEVERPPQYRPLSSTKKALGRPAESVEEDEIDVEDSGSSSDFTDGDDVGVPDFEDVINAPHPKTLLTSSGKLTARQRAMLTEPTASPTASYAESDLLFPAMKRVLTEEELLEKSELSRRRKHQREQALEERKVATIHRLLAKQSSRRNVGQKGRPPIVPREKAVDEDGTSVDQQEEAIEPEPKSRKKEHEEFLRKPLAIGTIRYHSTCTGAYLITSTPLFPFDSSDEATTRGNNGAAIRTVNCTCCDNAKQYVHAKTGQPLCAGLACYQKIR